MRDKWRIKGWVEEQGTGGGMRYGWRSEGGRRSECRRMRRNKTKGNNLEKTNTIHLGKC